jgi:hypothetical protein
MSDKPILVDLKKLREIISGLELKDAKTKEYIEARWLNYVRWWDSRARLAKWCYFTLRGAVMIGGAAIPALVGLQQMTDLGINSRWFAVASIVVSFVVAVSAGLDALFNCGEIWREKRAAAELIKSEGFSFFQLSGDYAQFETQQEASKEFAKNVENLIRNEIKDYILAATPKPEKTASAIAGNRPLG